MLLRQSTSAKKKHKIVGVYFTLANFEPFYRSSVDHLQLLLLCREQDFKYFGQEKFDNLGSHCIGGYTENFSTSSHCCRFCLVPRKEICNVTVRFPVRTVENYKEAVQLLQDSEETVVNGVKFDSFFNTLQYFHVCQPGLPPYIGHDLLKELLPITFLFTCSTL